MNGKDLQTFVEAFKEVLNLDPEERVFWVSKAMKIDVDLILREMSFDISQYVMWVFHMGDVSKTMMLRGGSIQGFIIISNKRLMFFKSIMKKSKSILWKSIELDPVMQIDIKDINNIKFKENFIEIFYSNKGEMDIVVFNEFRGFYPEHPGYEQIPNLINFDEVAKCIRGILSIDNEEIE